MLYLDYISKNIQFHSHHHISRRTQRKRDKKEKDLPQWWAVAINKYGERVRAQVVI
jgi:hypothetical protein